jgi:phage tail sheath protein FI
MPERLTPGVYIEEVSGGVKPIQGVGTSTAAFIGEAARGIPDRATFVTGFNEYERFFGGHRRNAAGFLAQSVQAFFNAGGRRAYVVRVLPASATTGVSPDLLARGRDAWGIQRRVLRFSAQGNGVWASSIRIHIEPSTAFGDQAFRIRVEWTEGGRSRTVETFDNVRMDPQHEDYAVEVINETSKYITAEDLFEGELIDAAERTQPPLPEQIAYLETRAESGTYRVPLNAVLDFSWRDTGVADPVTRRGTAEFSQAALTAALGGLSTDGNDVLLSAQQLQTFLDAALNPGDEGGDFRVTVPQGPASIATEAGPFDTGDGTEAVVNVDGVARNLVFTQTTAAVADIGPAAAADTFDIQTDDELRVTLAAGVQSYRVQAGDVTEGDATVEEMLTLLNRAFTAVQVFVEADTLRMRTDERGPGTTLNYTVTRADADLASIDATPGGGNVDDPAAVTATELAAIFNAHGGAFEARVDGDRVELVQTDLSAAHSIQWVSAPGPDVIVEDTTAHEGPLVSGSPSVRVEPRIASRAYLVVRLPDDQDALDVGGLTAIRLAVASADASDAFEADVSGDAGTLPLTSVAERLADALGDDPAYGLSVDAAGDYLVVSSEPQAAGVRLTLSTIGGAPTWIALGAVGGDAGSVVEAQRSVEVSVGERIQLGIPRVLGTLFEQVRGVGLEQNDNANPLLRPAATGDTAIRLLGGSDGQGPVGLTQYVGSESGRTGLHAFDTVDVNLLAIPGRNDSGYLSAAMSYCDAKDVFYIADGPGSTDRQFEMSASEAKQVVEGLPARSNNAAIFYPWIEVPDPVGVGRNPRRYVPPCGHMAGIFAHTDNSRGVWKAPAGIEATVSGAIDLQHDLVDGEQDLLNPIGLNCLRRFPNTGIVVWGSRTLASDPEWRYVPVRRTALFLKESIRRGLKWAVFEPNDQTLWGTIRLNINSFMMGLFRQGAFQGATPDEAFRVKCDRETNPQELVDQGIVTAQVAFAPLKPAEFVVIQISQKALVA